MKPILQPTAHHGRLCWETLVSASLSSDQLHAPLIIISLEKHLPDATVDTASVVHGMLLTELCTKCVDGHEANKYKKSYAIK